MRKRRGGVARTAAMVTMFGLVAALAVLGGPALSGSDVAVGQADATPEIEAEWLAGLAWRSIGPAVTGGRIDDVEAIPADPSTFYVGTASGGLWRTTNNGMSWTPVFDDQATSSIGDIALAPSNPSVVWVGTGEPNNRQSSTWGHGVYRSTDGGDTWEHLGLEDTHHIGRIVVHPEDPDRAWVAAVGRLWGPNPERGVFRTSDGGRTWDKVLFVDDDTGAIDVQMDAGDPELLYAATYQRRRRAWGFAGGGVGSGLYRSTDGGDTWVELTGEADHDSANGLPGGIIGRIGLATAPGRPGVVMALIEHGEAGGVYRSEDGGESWERVNELDPRPMYYSKIRIDPSDDRRVYVIAVEAYTSEDGGHEFRQLPIRSTYDVGVHSDLHALWIDPADPEHLILGGDGGLYDSHDRGQTWRKINNLAIGQFYGIGVDMRDPYLVYGGMQDNHSWRGPSATRRWAGIVNDDWQQIDFGDGMYTRPDPQDPDIVYVDAQEGDIIRFDARTGDRKAIRPDPGTVEAIGGGEVEEDSFRFDWTAPILISPHDHRTIYLGGNRLFISPDRGESWRATEDLTTGVDRDDLEIMGAVPDESTPSRHDGTSSYAEITTVAESPVRAGTLWVGTDDGVVQVSRDGGVRWEDVSEAVAAAGVPAGTYVSRVVADAEDPEAAYATFDGHRDDDFSAYVLETRDGGRTWSSIAAGLPADPVNVLVQHPRNASLLFVGTEHGVHVSFDRGGSWTSLRSNLPTVPVDDMAIHPRDNDLILGTHGRSIWILDDIGPLERLAGVLRGGGAGADGAVGDASGGVHAFPVQAATFFYPWKDTSYRAQAAYAAPNPPRGAQIAYWVKPELAASLAPSGDEGRAEPEQQPPVRVRLVDATGREVRTLRGPAGAGLNRIVWDLREAAPELGEGEDRFAPPGPFVPPGRYDVVVDVPAQADADPSTSAVEVRADPLLPLTDEGLGRRHAYLTSLVELQTRGHRLSGEAESLVEAVEQRRQRLEEEGVEIPEGLDRALQSIRTQASAARAALSGGFDSLRGGLAGLVRQIEGGGVTQGTLTPPTAAQERRRDRLAARLEQIAGDLDELQRDELEVLNVELRKAGLEAISTGGS